MKLFCVEAMSHQYYNIYPNTRQGILPNFFTTTTIITSYHHHHHHHRRRRHQIRSLRSAPMNSKMFLVSPSSFWLYQILLSLQLVTECQLQKVISFHSFETISHFCWYPCISSTIFVTLSFSDVRTSLVVQSSEA